MSEKKAENSYKNIENRLTPSPLHFENGEGWIPGFAGRRGEV